MSLICVGQRSYRLNGRKAWSSRYLQSHRDFLLWGAVLRFPLEDPRAEAASHTITIMMDFMAPGSKATRSAWRSYGISSGIAVKGEPQADRPLCSRMWA
ncbi:hypothetical protein AM571_PC01200 (plasmid) [Rhizobium etli 8C-3]|uniref:Uncharacterized protein n=1 Tax=Rhizobium etli 8C-3 TaxID=538025 RepID=A0A1L5PFM4_RHIET|nr:hypothetical protein AM571_PC01200 [Rhizobium etli 8C-3]